MLAAWSPAGSLPWCHHERMRLDEEKLEALRGWGEKLGESGSEEYAAVGRAILMLVAEIDRLHIDLWHARMTPSEEQPVVTVEKESVAITEAEEAEPVASRLHARLQRVLRRNTLVESVEHSESNTESGETTSAQAWLAELRRQR